MAPDDFKNLGLVFDDAQGKGNTQAGSPENTRRQG